MTLFKIIAFSVTQNLLEYLIHVIENASVTTRSEEGVNQGVRLFTNVNHERAVCKIHDPSDAVNVQLANELLGFFGLRISQSFIVGASNSDYDRLQTFFSKQAGSDKELRKQLKGTHVFLVMDFVDGTTFSDLLPADIDRAFSDHSVLSKLGIALFLDLLLGNHDRFISLNLGNLMLNKKTGEVTFIDNNIDYSPSESEMPYDILRIANALADKADDNPIDFFLKLLADKEIFCDPVKFDSVRQGLYAGFCAAYSILSHLSQDSFSGVSEVGGTLVQREHVDKVKEFIINRMKKVMSMVDVKRHKEISGGVIEGILDHIDSGDMNRLTLAAKLLENTGGGSVCGEIKNLIELMRSYKETRNEVFLPEINKLTQSIKVGLLQNSVKCESQPKFS